MLLCPCCPCCCWWEPTSLADNQLSSKMTILRREHFVNKKATMELKHVIAMRLKAENPFGTLKHLILAHRSLLCYDVWHGWPITPSCRLLPWQLFNCAVNKRWHYDDIMTLGQTWYVTGPYTMCEWFPASFPLYFFIMWYCAPCPKQLWSKSLDIKVVQYKHDPTLGCCLMW